jgi:hypothetical protein
MYTQLMARAWNPAEASRPSFRDIVAELKRAAEGVPRRRWPLAPYPK